MNKGIMFSLNSWNRFPVYPPVEKITAGCSWLWSQVGRGGAAVVMVTGVM
ncbi:hypothetical protein HanRHA438_Chr13g0604661 [Helianthus annuus]|nr:hypothetical protein HanIR_Chr13g0646211 [Helianthus annuus]KAJ0858751.1 hypothetical protein HanRHA438_Chr13g0604661 [Helianthus annuus]